MFELPFSLLFYCDFVFFGWRDGLSVFFVVVVVVAFAFEL